MHGFKLLNFDNKELWTGIVPFLERIGRSKRIEDTIIDMAKIKLILREERRCCIFKLLFRLSTRLALFFNKKYPSLRTYTQNYNNRRLMECYSFPDATKTLQIIAKLVLETDKHFDESEYKHQASKRSIESISLKRNQVACLLGHMIFGLIPDSNNENFQKERSFENILSHNNQKSQNFLKSFLLYFNKISSAAFSEYSNIALVYKRVSSNENLRRDFWSDEKLLTKMTIDNEKAMEDIDESILIDFANKRIGGGVLRRGITQEEIMFIVRPEMIVSVLLFEKMNNNEAITFNGVIQYSIYKGSKILF
jgi:hypothetical protein